MRSEALVTHLRQYLPQADEKKVLVMFRYILKHQG